MCFLCRDDHSDLSTIHQTRQWHNRRPYCGNQIWRMVNSCFCCSEMTTGCSESQRQASLAAGRTAIGEAYSEGLREIQGQIPELLGKRNLVGVGPNVISATTPGQQVYSRGVQSLTAQKMAALANLEGRGAQSAFASLDPQLQALGLYGEEEGGGMMDFLSSIAGIGGTFYGMQQQGEQNKWLRDLLKGDDDTIDTTADVSNVGTLSNPRGESVVRL